VNTGNYRIFFGESTRFRCRSYGSGKVENCDVGWLRILACAKILFPQSIYADCCVQLCAVVCGVKEFDGF